MELLHHFVAFLCLEVVFLELCDKLTEITSKKPDTTMVSLIKTFSQKNFPLEDPNCCKPVS